MKKQETPAGRVHDKHLTEEETQQAADVQRSDYPILTEITLHSALRALDRQIN